MTAPSLVTAAILVIGDEILSGRTKDKNIGYIAEYLTNIGIDLKEVRVVADEEDEIVAALNALRARYTYVFTTGGIGPTHDDITADSVAKAFGVTIDVDPRARAIMEENYKSRGIEMNEARLRMARIPAGADLVEANSGPPGFRIGNVIVMAGVPSIMQVMLDSAAPKLKTGVKMISETIKRRRARGRYRHRARRDRQAASERLDRQLSVLRREDRAEHQSGDPLARCRASGGREGRCGGDAEAGAGRTGRLTGLPTAPACDYLPSYRNNRRNAHGDHQAQRIGPLERHRQGGQGHDHHAERRPVRDALFVLAPLRRRKGH